LVPRGKPVLQSNENLLRRTLSRFSRKHDVDELVKGVCLVTVKWLAVCSPQNLLDSIDVESKKLKM
jgi:hypothetical protein